MLRLENAGMTDLLNVSPCSTSGWRPAGKPLFEVRNLQRTLKNSSVPVPKTLLRMILNATLPRLLQRTLLVALPPELGQYLLACKQGVHIAGAALPQVGAMTTHSCNKQRCTAHHNAMLKYSQTLRVCMQDQMMEICPPCHSGGQPQDGHGFCQWRSPCMVFTGEAGIVGPALSCFDVDLSAASRPGAAPKNATEAKRMAQQHATAQEARSMLGICTPQASMS